MLSRLGLNTSTIWTTSLDKSIQVTDNVGFDVIELRIPIVKKYLETHMKKDFQSLFEARHVQPLSLNAIEGFNPESDAVFLKVQGQVREAAEIADAIGCPYIILVPQPEPLSWEEAMQRTRERLIQICEIMKSYQVQPLVEFIGFERFPLRMFEQAIQLVESVEQFHVGIVFDTFHHLIRDPKLGTVELQSLDLSRIAIVHLDDLKKGGDKGSLTDSDRAMPGDGYGNLQTLVKQLQAGGVSGPYSVELFSEDYWVSDPVGVAKLAFKCTSSMVKG